MAMNIRNTFPKPSTRFALLSTLFFSQRADGVRLKPAGQGPACVCIGGACAFMSRAHPRMQAYQTVTWGTRN